MMPPSTLHPTPRWRRVIVEQYRAVGLAIRPAMIVVGALIAVTSLLAGLAALREGIAHGVTPELALNAALIASLLPIAVWKGEYTFQRSHLASLPVDRRHHALAKVGAGWVWLMVLVAVLLLWMLGLAVVTGGAIGVDEMRVLTSDLPSGLLAGDVDSLALPWSTPAWQWAVIFTGATVAYLVGSAVVLAGSRVRRWLAGVTVVLFFLILFRDEVVLSGGVETWTGWVLDGVVLGRYGLVNLFTLTDASVVTTAAGEELPVYSDPPMRDAWAGATLLWTGVALASLLVVIWRPRRS